MTHAHGALKLTTAQEAQLVEQARDGSRSALDALFAAHRRQVEFLARQRPTGGCPHEDLVQQGYLGLLRAVERFEPERGLRFWTYARWWVRAMIRAYVWRNRRIVPLSSSRAHRKVAGQLRRLESRYGDNAAQLAADLQVDEDDVARVQQALAGGDVSLDHVSSPAMVPTATESSPESETERHFEDDQRRRLVERTLGALDARERRIVERRYLSEEPESLSQLGREMGISRERVRQLCERALGKLRAAMREAHPHVDQLVA